uniref:Acyl-CoA thioesterase I (Protease I) (Lysophospholipase L1) (Lecithinase B) n=1 Tax=mine drainage metagenome TaxID=410659 RepID=E6QII8_9ZZZZ
MAACIIPTALCAYPAQKTLVCFGDSITAGYGLPESQSYPVDLDKLLAASHSKYRVINRGVPGDTTKDALARLPSILALRPNAVVLEFGGNDGLRGIAVDQTRRNLTKIVTAFQAAQIRILLVGITLPPNYGADYIASFQKIFSAVAHAQHVPLMPMIYDGIYTLPGTIQPDGIHPTAKGSAMIAEHMLPYLAPLLK